jgi:hypothetical protein
MKLEYSSILHSLGIMVILIVALVMIYFVFMFFEGKVDNMPTFIQDIHYNYIVKDVDQDYDYLVGHYTHGDDHHHHHNEETHHSHDSSPSDDIPSVAPKEEKVEEHSDSHEEHPITSCPTSLTQDGDKIKLLNENEPEEPGKNPIYFDSLDDYAKYYENQKHEGQSKCPILELKETEERKPLDKLNLSNINTISDYFKRNAPKEPPSRLPLTNALPYVAAPLYNAPLEYQTQMALQETPSQPVVQKQPPLVPYLDANRDLNPRGHYGFDPSDQYVGKYTILDEIHDSTKTEFPSGLSANAMDTNWGGASFTSEKLYEKEYQEQHEPPTTTLPILNKPVQHFPGKTSADPMDPNWGGADYSQKAVDQGQYQGNEVYQPVNNTAPAPAPAPGPSQSPK